MNIVIQLSAKLIDVEHGSANRTPDQVAAIVMHRGPEDEASKTNRDETPSADRDRWELEPTVDEPAEARQSDDGNDQGGSRGKSGDHLEDDLGSRQRRGQPQRSAEAEPKRNGKPHPAHRAPGPDEDPDRPRCKEPPKTQDYDHPGEGQGDKDHYLLWNQTNLSFPEARTIEGRGPPFNGTLLRAWPRLFLLAIWLLSADFDRLVPRELGRRVHRSRPAWVLIGRLGAGPNGILG